MSLATLLNIPGEDDQNTFDEFSFSNQDSHNRIIRAIGDQNGVTLQVYIVDPMPLADLGAWFRNHQQMHNDMNGVTGVSGNDLSSVDWKDEQAKAYWISLHWSEHQQNEQKLGIG